MVTEKLKRKRALNVQEQNALCRYRIMQEAMYWRECGVPAPIQSIFADLGLLTQHGIFLNYTQNEWICSTDEGYFMAHNGRIYAFDADLNAEKTILQTLYACTDVTEQFEVNARKPGSGATWAYLALQVLHELQYQANSDVQE